MGIADAEPMGTNGEQETRDAEGESGEEVEFEDAVSELERVESKRRRLGVIIGIAALVLLAVALVVLVQFRTLLFRPKMPVEEGRRQIITETDDPQCREMISEVTNIGNTFFAMEGRIEKHLPGEDLEAIRGIDAELATLEKRLDEAEALSHQSALRFESSAKELEKWFSYVDYELRILRSVASNEIERLGGASARSEDAGDADVGVGAESDAGTAADADASAAETTEESKRPPEERRDGALVALHDAFEEFRVWHSGSHSVHPCGDADKDETPWRPEDWNPDGGLKGPDAE